MSKRRGLSREANPHWTEDPTYFTIHKRLRRWFGPAKKQNCVECDKPALHWSYDHKEDDQNRRYVQDGPMKGVAYSLDIARYQPRCGPCHKLFDIKRCRPRITHCKQGHEFTEENTYFKPSGMRCCRACDRLTTRKYKAKKRAIQKAGSAELQSQTSPPTQQDQLR